MAVASLSAALLLGLREQFGGSPQHLGVETIADPNPNGPNTRALLIHDRMPGGTGYLAELAAPDRMWEVLRGAWLVLRDCECSQESRLAFHRCLLPFAWPDQADLVSRESAARHLGDLLGVSPDGDVSMVAAWQPQELPPNVDPTNESYLEVLFRSLFRKLAEDLGGVVTEIPGGTGNTILVRFGEVSWRLTPQVNVGNAKPDFVLSRPGLPDVAIFTDGFTFHGTPAHNRVADDAFKRRTLHEAGHLVLAVSIQDAVAEQGDTPALPSWFHPGLAAQAMGSFGYNQDAQSSLLRGPFGWLRGWLQGTQAAAMTGLSNSLPLHFTMGQGGFAVDESTDLVAAVKGLIDDPSFSLASGQARAWWWTHDHLGVLVRARTQALIDVVVLLDDRDEAVASPTFRDSWLLWLELSNVLQNRGAEALTLLTSYSADDGLTSTVVVQPSVDAVPTGTAWDEVRTQIVPEAVSLVEELIAAHLPPPDAVGDDIGRHNIPVELAWTGPRVAVLINPEPEDVSDLEQDGWRVLEPVAAAIRSALEEDSSWPSQCW